LGEIAICVPLFDPNERVAELKRRVSVYPEALRRAVVQRYLWGAEFSLESFASKFAARGDVPNTAGCLARVAHELALVLFALNGRYWLSDKTALAEIAESGRLRRTSAREMRRSARWVDRRASCSSRSPRSSHRRRDGPRLRTALPTSLPETLERCVDPAAAQVPNATRPAQEHRQQLRATPGSVGIGNRFVTLKAAAPLFTKRGTGGHRVVGWVVGR
jgi:hypothetical protein